MAEVIGDCKPVQELVENGEYEVPDAYIWKDSSNYNYGPVDLNVPLGTDIPVVDLSQLTSSSSSAMDAELRNLRSALASWGCFQGYQRVGFESDQAINHGIETSFLDEVRELSRKFFHLPMKEKQKYARPKDDIEGYGTDMVLFENQSLDWTDRLYLLVRPEDQQKLQYWPENPDSFRSMLHEYSAKTTKIQELLLWSLARSLSLPDDCLLNRFGSRPMTYARFNYYPPCKRPDRVHGLKPHSDGSGITILLQDKEVEGLQMLRDNQWFRVPIMPYALLVNVGDQLEIMTNGMIKSPIHRALTNSERDRNTLVMFCAPDVEQDIEPAEELVDENNPRLYRRIKNYPKTYFHYFQQGRRPIEAVKI